MAKIVFILSVTTCCLAVANLIGTVFFDWQTPQVVAVLLWAYVIYSSACDIVGVSREL